MKTKNILQTAVAAVALMASATALADNVSDLKHCLRDSAIIYPESFEMDAHKRMQSWYLKNYTSTDSAYVRMPDVEASDAEIIKRLQAMPTVIEMPYNEVVKDYIKRYTKDGRAQVSAMLGLSIYYMPIFEQALEEKGLPLELKYLPVIESALDPNAVSKSGATGLWQMTLATGKGLGLEVNSLIDERRDPYRSSERAASLLKELYDSYGDWSLAIAAYNCGPNELNKAIRRAGGDAKKVDFWTIYNYLRPETRGYVPNFIAANYVMTYHNKHNIHPVLATKPLVTDTVAVRERISLKQVSAVLDIPVEELRILNPQFRADIIPASVDNQYFLILPSQQIHAYLLSEDDIFAYNRDEFVPRERVEIGDDKGDYQSPEIEERKKDIETTTQAPKEEKKTVATTTQTAENNYILYKVKAGDTLADIAKAHGVEPADIKTWNNLRRNSVRTGQQLRIYTDGSAPDNSTEVARQPKTETKKTETKKPRNTTYVVKSGDSLERIARKYGITVDQLRKLNPKLKKDVLHPGDKVIVPGKGSSTGGGSKSGTTKKTKKKKGRRR